MLFDVHQRAPLFLMAILATVTCLSSSCGTWQRLRGTQTNAGETRDQNTGARNDAPKKTAASGETMRLPGAKATDGIVSFTNTNYQQCSFGQSAQLQVCTGQAGSMNHFRAADYCARLTLGNLRWRLPHREELEAIVITEQSFTPLTDPDVFPGTPPKAYWTDTQYHDSSGSYWTVDFYDGRARGAKIFSNAYVRCVANIK